MEEKKSRTAEILRFALCGGVCFLVELALLILLKGRLGIDTLIATPIAFLVSVILNYLLCVAWVFRGAKNRSAGAKAGFLITSVIGLGLNELLMFLFRLILGRKSYGQSPWGFSIPWPSVRPVQQKSLARSLLGQVRHGTAPIFSDFRSFVLPLFSSFLPEPLFPVKNSHPNCC